MKRLALLTALALAGCRGQPSEDPPVHFQPVPQMDWQPKYLPEGESRFFLDHRAMRPLVAGTLAQDELVDDDVFHTGRVGDLYIARVPEKVDETLIRRGRARFSIYCTPCHDATGSGHGIVVQRGFPPPVDLNSDRVRNMADGEIFDVISHGRRNMPSYGLQVPAEDRWAIVSWVRVIERSQRGSLQDVPEEQRSAIEGAAQ